MYMYNWSVDEKKLKKYPEKYKIWQLEQLINYGLGGNKIAKKDFKKYLPKLSIDPEKKRFLKFLLSAK